MTKEYILRDEMIEQTKARIVLGAPKFNTGLKAAIEVATSIPAIDVVEIVHCKECKFGEWNAVECAYWCQGHFRRPDWYCADAKSKDGGQDE